MAYDPNDPNGIGSYDPTTGGPVNPDGTPLTEGIWRDEGGVLRNADGSLYNLGFKANNPPNTPLPGAPPDATPPPAGPSGAPPAAPAPPGGGSLIKPFDLPPPPTPGTGTDYVPPTPTFKGPPIRTPDPFKAPSADDVFNEPGFQARLRGGTDRLQNWAAARGTLNDSGTAKALIDYGQGEASQEYGNVWDRAYNAYNANNITQFVQPWTQAFQEANTQNANDLTGYTTKAAAGQYQKNADYLDQYNQWLAKYGIYDKNQSDTFDRQYKLLTS